MLRGIRNKLILSVALGALVFLALSVYSDIGELRKAFARFDATFIPAALGLASLNYLLRFVRWHAYLRIVRMPLGLRDSFAIFLAGLAMSVTPGKAGELLKSYLARIRVGTPIARSAPVVLAERLTDVISLIALSLVGVASFRFGLLPLVAGGAGTAMLLVALGHRGTAAFVIRLIGRLPLVGKLAEPLGRAYEGVRLLVSPVHLLWAGALGAAAWFAECLGFYLVLLGFQVDLGVVPVTFIYSFATLFGAVTMMPGGVGPTEGSMSGLLAYEGMALPDAVAATLVIRVCTLWFAVALGAGALVVFRRRFAADPEDEAELEAVQGVKVGRCVDREGSIGCSN